MYYVYAMGHHLSFLVIKETNRAAHADKNDYNVNHVGTTVTQLPFVMHVSSLS